MTICHMCWGCYTTETYNVLYINIYLPMKEMVIKNASGLNKFTRGEHVLTDGVVENGEVRVYKLDSDWDILVNSRGNKVSYTLNVNRLTDVDKDTHLRDEAGPIEKRVMDKTFTDKKLDLAADQIVIVNAFIDLTTALKNKLSTIANNLMWKVNELTESADTYNAPEFEKVLGEMTALTDYLKDKPMTDIKALSEKIAPMDTGKTYDPKTILD